MEGRWPVKVQPLRYYGGKQAKGKAEWICSLLPWRKDSVYVETHGGMATVMARRAPVKCEIYNDLNGYAVNWFRILREQTSDFIHLVTLTPQSRKEYEQALGMIDDSDDLMRAWAFHIVISQGMSGSIGGKKEWAVGKHPKNTPHLGYWKNERIEEIYNRFRTVQLENRDAIDLLDWISDMQDTVIYCDPPYRTSTISKYEHSEVDVNRLTDSLLSQQGEVAISGYGDEWEHLNWQRHELESWIVSNGANKISEPRTEVLWTNYDAHSEQSIGGLFA